MNKLKTCHNDSMSRTSKVWKTVKLDVRPWGEMTMLEQRPRWWVKKISVNPGSRTSLQKHAQRSELWHVVEGEIQAIVMGKSGKTSVKKIKAGTTLSVPPQVPHRIASKNGAVLIEIGYGAPSERDIVRLEDDYGRAGKAPKK